MDTYTNRNTSSSDPDAMKSRVFIGHLATDRIIRQDLQLIFEKYGPVEAVSILQGYAFIQFTNECDAVKAVDNERGTIIEGSAVDIKMAIDGKSKPNMFKDSPGRSPRGGRGGGRGNFRGGSGGGNWNNRGGGGPMGSPRGGGGGGYYRGGSGGSPMNYGDNRRGGGGYGGGDRKRNYNGGYNNHHENTPQKQRRNTTDDTAVLFYVVGDSPKVFAESIEKRLSSAYIQVRMRNISLEDSVDELVVAAKREGFPYTIVVKPDNELHRSMTVNVLHGSPQDHINMNIDGAIPMIIRNYNSYLRVLENKTFPQCPEERMADLLVAISKGRHVKNADIDRVVDYLGERKITNDEKDAQALKEEEEEKEALKMATELKLESNDGDSSSTPVADVKDEPEHDLDDSVTNGAEVGGANEDGGQMAAQDGDDQMDFTVDTEEENFVDKHED